MARVIPGMRCFSMKSAIISSMLWPSNPTLGLPRCAVTRGAVAVRSSPDNKAAASFLLIMRNKVGQNHKAVKPGKQTAQQPGRTKFSILSPGLRYLGCLLLTFFNASKPQRHAMKIGLEELTQKA